MGEGVAVCSFFGEGAQNGGNSSLVGGRGGRGSPTTVVMMNATSHSAAVSVFFNDGADFVLECSTSEQVVV